MKACGLLRTSRFSAKKTKTKQEDILDFQLVTIHIYFILHFRHSLKFDFKTNSGNGTLFYAVRRNDVYDMVSCGLHEGFLQFKIRCKSSYADLTIPFRVDDGEWHRVRTGVILSFNYVQCKKSAFLHEAPFDFYFKCYKLNRPVISIFGKFKNLFVKFRQRTHTQKYMYKCINTCNNKCVYFIIHIW